MNDVIYVSLPHRTTKCDRIILIFRIIEWDMLKSAVNKFCADQCIYGALAKTWVSISERKLSLFSEVSISWPREAELFGKSCRNVIQRQGKTISFRLTPFPSNSVDFQRSYNVSSSPMRQNCHRRQTWRHHGWWRHYDVFLPRADTLTRINEEVSSRPFIWYIESPSASPCT